MFNVNAFCLKFDTDSKDFCFSKSQLLATNLDDYSGLLTVVVGDMDKLVKLDEPCIVSFCECTYYTTSSVSDIDILNMLEKELIKFNTTLINRSNNVIRLLEDSCHVR